jgi:hypothetical protein
VGYAIAGLWVRYPEAKKRKKAALTQSLAPFPLGVMAGAHKRGRGDDAGDGDAAAPASKSAALSRPFCAPREGGVAPGAQLAGLSASDARAHTAAASAQVAAVRHAYRMLSAPRAPGDLAAADEAFGALLAAAAGCPSAQRLAAAFIPRFASRAPARLDAAAAALAALAEGNDAASALSGASRAASVAGLAALAATAAATQGAETRAGKAACSALLRLAAVLGDAAAGDALRTALDGAPQAVLSALLLAFVARDDASVRRGARDWAVASLPPAALQAALKAHPATAAWLRASASALCKGAPAELVAEAQPVLDLLIRTAEALAPKQAELPPPPPQWRGRLCKSGAVVCDAAALQVPTHRATAAYDDSWPAVLDVLARAETAHVLDVLLRACRPEDAALRRLVPLSEAGELRSFSGYLYERRRCGVVRLAAPARLLYLIPPAPAVAAALGAAELPRDAPPDFLWALVLPDTA